jgi:hypothetical protein
VNQQASPGNQPPPGLLYHAAGPSEEALQEFFTQTLGQALQQANISTQPTFFQVINTMQP